MLHHKSWHDWYWTEFGHARRTGREAAALLRSTFNLWDLADVSINPVAVSLCFMGHLDESTTVAEETAPIAERTGHFGAGWFSDLFKAMNRILQTGDIDAFL